jgi:hypothetical protein
VFRLRYRCPYSKPARILAIFFIGPIRLRMVRVHHASRNFMAHFGLVYTKNRWKSSWSRCIQCGCVQRETVGAAAGRRLRHWQPVQAVYVGVLADHRP